MNKLIIAKFGNMPHCIFQHVNVSTLISVLNGRVWFLVRVCKFIQPLSLSALARIIYVPCFHLIISRALRSKTE